MHKIVISPAHFAWRDIDLLLISLFFHHSLHLIMFLIAVQDCKGMIVKGGQQD